MGGHRALGQPCDLVSTLIRSDRQRGKKEQRWRKRKKEFIVSYFDVNIDTEKERWMTME